jgi:hypothetical protein
MELDKLKLKELVCQTFLDNKKLLMKKGSNTSETIQAALMKNLST